jgi:hypothetical protein
VEEGQWKILPRLRLVAALDEHHGRKDDGEQARSVVSGLGVGISALVSFLVVFGAVTAG